MERESAGVAIETNPVVSRTVTVPCAHGMHVRVASRMVALAQGLQSEVWLSSNTRSANAKSILGLLELGVAQGAPLTITARGPDAEEAVQAVERLLRSAAPCA